MSWFTCGGKVHRIGRSRPCRRQRRRSQAARMAVFNRWTSGTPGRGSTRGFATKRFGSTSTHPPRLRPSFAAIRRRSRRDAVGRRIPTELTQSTRLVLARIRMMWVLLVGSPSQSLAKHRMGSPSSTGGVVTGMPGPGRITDLFSRILVPCRRRGRPETPARPDRRCDTRASGRSLTRDADHVLAVEEDSLPDFQVGEEPETIAMLRRPAAVLFGKALKHGRLEQSSAERAGAEHELLDD